VRKLWCLLAALMLLALLTTAVSADSTAVTSMRTDCAVEADGACTVTLEFTVNFAQGTKEFEIPISSAARDVQCVGASYRLVSGTGCKLLRLEGSFSGPMTLTVSYRLAETVTDDGSSQEFLVHLLYPYWSCPILRYEATVRLPGRFDSLPVFLSGYYGDLIDNYMDITIEDGSIHAVLNEKQTLQDHEAMSVQLQLPEGFFDLRFLAGKTAAVDKLLFFGLLLLTALYWAVFLRNLPILPKRQAMPPEGGNAGEIPFVLTDRDPDLALMVVQWASLGYLTITRARRGSVFLTRLMDMDTERKRFEGEIFRTLFSRSERCDVRSAEYLKARRTAVEKTKKFWQNRVYDPKAGATVFLRLLAAAAGLVLCLACFDLCVASKSWRWFVILPLTLTGAVACWLVQQLGGFLLRRHSLRTALLAVLAAAFLLLTGKYGGLNALMLLNIAVQLTVGFLVRCGGRRTKGGAALGAELLGYRRYLLSTPSEQLCSHLEADPQFFYRVLPYADALQIGRLFAGSFDGARLENCDWLLWEGKELHSAPAFYNRYRSLTASLRGERDPAARRQSRPKRAPVSTRTAPPTRRNPGARPGSAGRRSAADRGRTAAGRGRTPTRRSTDRRGGRR
jgi:Predicted membrane protein (DUF2207).